MCDSAVLEGLAPDEQHGLGSIEFFITYHNLLPPSWIQILQISKCSFADRTNSWRVIKVVVCQDYFLEMSTCKVSKHQSGRWPLLTAFGFDQLSMDNQLLQQLNMLSITHNYHKIITTMFFLNDHICNVMKNVEGTLTSSQSNRISPHMVNGEQLTTLFEKIVEVARRCKCKLLVNNPFELYDQESSYGYSEHNQTMYVA